jgi:thymidylate kinase
MLTKNGIVIFDRYYHDLLIDTKRYRYKGPLWLVNLIGKILPKPDLVILLDAPAEILQSRKKEVPFSETQRQQNAYRSLVSRLPNGYIVNVAKPFEQVAGEIEGVIIGFLHSVK